MVLVVVPLCGLAAMSGTIVVDRHRTATNAADVHVVVDRVTDLVTARSDLRAERVAAEASLQARALGFTDEQVLALIGFDPRIELVARARDSDEALARLADADQFVDRRELGELRTQVQGSTIDADSAGHRFEAQIARLQSAITAKLDELDHDTRGMSGGEDIVSSLNAVRALGDQTEAVYTEMVAFENLFLGRGDRFTWHEALISARTTDQATRRQLDAVTFAPVADAWRAIRDSDDAETVDTVPVSYTHLTLPTILRV